MRSIKHIDDALYGLEREYGQRFVLVTTLDVVTSPNRGYLNVSKSTLHPKGIILPTEHLRKFFQDVGYLRANSNFTYGGNLDFRDKIILVRRKQLPPNFDLNLTHQVLHKGLRYDSVKIEEIFDRLAYAITLKHTEGTLNYNQTDVRVDDQVDIQELAGTQ